MRERLTFAGRLVKGIGLHQLRAEVFYFTHVALRKEQVELINVTLISILDQHLMTDAFGRPLASISFAHCGPAGLIYAL